MSISHSPKLETGLWSRHCYQLVWQMRVRNSERLNNLLEGTQLVSVEAGVWTSVVQSLASFFSHLTEDWGFGRYAEESPIQFLRREMRVQPCRLPCCLRLDPTGKLKGWCGLVEGSPGCSSLSYLDHGNLEGSGTTPPTDMLPLCCTKTGSLLGCWAAP
jgi:hypothetical protein